jgi:hypothetical protein
MAQVAAYRASGLKAKAWAQANGVPLGTLGSWCAHYRRWQAKFDGGVSASAGPAMTRSTGFVAACVATPASASSVRIEVNAGVARLELHWPLAYARELAALLRDLGR